MTNVLDLVIFSTTGGWSDSPELCGSLTNLIKFDCHRVFMVKNFFTEHMPLLNVNHGFRNVTGN